MGYSRNTNTGGGVTDGVKGDIRVTASGATWTVENSAITNAKINDVDASKVTQSSSYRFITDTQKSTWDSKQSALSNADTSTNGILTSTDWNTFNGKQSALGFTAVANTTSISTTSPLNGGGDLSANRTLSIAQSNGSTNGFLSSTDWTTFNNKLSSLSSASAFITGEVSITAATYADITGASISLASGTWLLFGTVNGRVVNATFVMFVAITDGSNNIICESAQNSPASASASSNNWGSVSLTAIVSPASTTTYKLRGARGFSGPTTSWTASDGIGINTANNGTNNSDKSTGIFAIKIA